MNLFNPLYPLIHQYAKNSLSKKKYSKLAILAFLLLPIHAQASVSLVSPAVNENITTNNPEFVWQDQSDATHFQVQVRDISNYNTDSKWWKRADVCDGTLCRSTVPGVDLQYSKNHWWRARALTNGVWQAWTPVSRFHYADSPPGAITMITPSGGSTLTDISPTFIWNDYGNVSRYQIWVYDQVLRTRVHLSHFVAEDVCNDGVCSFTPEGLNLEIGANHSWMVRALNSGGWGAWQGWANRAIFNVEPISAKAIGGDTLDTNNALYTRNTSDNTTSFISKDITVERYAKVEAGNLLFVPNAYDIRNAIASNSIVWEATFSGNDPCVASDVSDIKLTYNISDVFNGQSVEDTTYVRAFPSIVLGTMNGRFETWNSVDCENNDQFAIPGYTWQDTERAGNSKVFNLANAATATGYPVKAGSVQETSITAQADIYQQTGGTINGVANFFLDTYFHDVSELAYVPGKNATERNMLDNTVDGINGNVSRVWNMNFWFSIPDFENNQGNRLTRSSATGGLWVGNVFTGGYNFEIYVKIEGSKNSAQMPTCRVFDTDADSGNVEPHCFVYVALVATNSNIGNNGFTLNFKQAADWFTSSAFENMFTKTNNTYGNTGGLDGSTPTAIRNMIESNRDTVNTWLAELVRGTSHTLDFPGADHVIGGLHLGNELWFNPGGNPAEINYTNLGFKVGNNEFGEYSDIGNQEASNGSIRVYADGLGPDDVIGTPEEGSCDYSAADQNNGWGYNPTDPTQQCPPVEETPEEGSCDYSAADQNNGWGYNPTDPTQQCLPLEETPEEGGCDYSAADQNNGWGYNPTDPTQQCPPVE